jgi:SAM-dependent methyltransferase
MGEEWSIAEAFDADYLRFYLPMLPADVSDAQTAVIWDILGLQRGDRVLDLACGHGRISNRLSARGAEVTGIDATQQFLDIAKADAQRSGLRVEYMLGDVRDLTSLKQFDAVVSWFTSFGYFDDDQNRAVLLEAFGSLTDGGKLLIELNQKDAVLTNWAPVSVTHEGQAIMIDERTFDPITSRSICDRTIIREGQVRRFQFFVRMFSFVELRDWLVQTGFRTVDGYANDGSQLKTDTMRMILVATK